MRLTTEQLHALARVALNTYIHSYMNWKEDIDIVCDALGVEYNKLILGDYDN